MNNKSEFKKLTLIYGFSYGVLGVALSIILYTMDRELIQPTWAFLVKILLGFLTTFIAIYLFKKNNHSFLKVEQALKLGLAISLVAGVIEATSNQFYFTKINPEADKEMLIQYEKNLREEKKYTEKELALIINDKEQKLRDENKYTEEEIANSIRNEKQGLKEETKYTEEEIAQAIEINKNRAKPWSRIPVNIIFHVFLGAIYSLICGLILHKPSSQNNI